MSKWALKFVKNFICLVTGYKNLFDQKELQIKMSSLLNVSNDTGAHGEIFRDTGYLDIIECLRKV